MTEAQTWAALGVLAAAFFGMMTIVSTMFTRVLRTEIGGVNTRIDSMSDRLDGRIDSMSDSLDGRIDSLRSEMTARFEAVDARFDAVNTRIDSLDRDIQGIISRELGRG